MASDFKSLSPPQKGEQTRELPTWMAKSALPCASMWSLAETWTKCWIVGTETGWGWSSLMVLTGYVYTHIYIYTHISIYIKGLKLSGWDLHWCNLLDNFIVAEHFCWVLGWLVRLRNGEAKRGAWNVEWTEWTEWTSMDISICRFWKGQTSLE